MSTKSVAVAKKSNLINAINQHRIRFEKGFNCLLIQNNFELSS